MVEGFKNGFYATSQKQERKPETSILDHTYSFNQSSFQYISELQNLQEENHRLSKKIKRNRRKNLRSNFQQQKFKIRKRYHKNRNSRQITFAVSKYKNRTDGINQFAELIENIFLQNVPLNNPMDVEPDVKTEKMLIKRKKNNADIVEKSDISQDTVEALKENKI